MFWQDTECPAEPQDNLVYVALYIHVVSSGLQHGAISLHSHPVTLNYLTGVFIFPFPFYFRVFVHVHAHSFIFSHLGWCFLGLTLRPKSQILKMVLVERKLVKCVQMLK